MHCPWYNSDMKKYAQGTVEYEIEKSKDEGIKPRLLLHACCGPCLAGTLANISDFFDITVFFYNPNIMPKDEFNIRLQALEDVDSHFDGNNSCSSGAGRKRESSGGKGL